MSHEVPLHSFKWDNIVIMSIYLFHSTTSCPLVLFGQPVYTHYIAHTQRHYLLQKKHGKYNSGGKEVTTKDRVQSILYKVIHMTDAGYA